MSHDMTIPASLVPTFVALLDYCLVDFLVATLAYGFILKERLTVNRWHAETGHTLTASTSSWRCQS